eukprot:CAMPEP_0183528712 /NCGR_PEP_ID=MMETSP0371-20130417/22897_1 /TAXON_ID=268820 /ORGANISM="Peridinium aciculiferum, Strain PAER-2" /LENGTH=76 /DNA_ID=CAMNT_0025728371 /DNA_START=47 /DNA_END=273 /DNA_ORIENTATION=+
MPIAQDSLRGAAPINESKGSVGQGARQSRGRSAYATRKTSGHAEMTSALATPQKWHGSTSRPIRAEVVTALASNRT